MWFVVQYDVFFCSFLWQQNNGILSYYFGIRSDENRLKATNFGLNFSETMFVVMHNNYCKYCNKTDFKQQIKAKTDTFFIHIHIHIRIDEIKKKQQIRPD